MPRKKQGAAKSVVTRASRSRSSHHEDEKVVTNETNDKVKAEQKQQEEKDDDYDEEQKSSSSTTKTPSRQNQGTPRSTTKSLHEDSEENEDDKPEPTSGTATTTSTLQSKDLVLANILFPILQAVGDKVIYSNPTDASERLEYWYSFQKLYNMFPFKNLTYGAIYHRWQLASLLVSLTIARIKEEQIRKLTSSAQNQNKDNVNEDKEEEEEEEGSDGELQTTLSALQGIESSHNNNSNVSGSGSITDNNESTLPVVPWSQWTGADWMALHEYLQSLAETLVHVDATLTPPFTRLEGSGQSLVDQELAQSPLFQSKLVKVGRYLQCFAILAPMRVLLETQINNHQLSDETLPKVPQKTLDAVWQAVQATEDESVRLTFEQRIFNVVHDEKKSSSTNKTGKNNNNEHKKRAATPPLQTLGALRVNLNAKPFPFVDLEEKINILVASWNQTILEESILHFSLFPEDEELEEEEGARQLPSGVDPEPNTSFEVERLIQARENLAQRGVDPLAAAVAMAEQVQTLAATYQPINEPPGATPPHRTSRKRKLSVNSATRVVSSSSPSKRRMASRRRTPRSGSKLYQRKSTATRLQFDDDEEVASPPKRRNVHDSRVELSQLPERPNTATAEQVIRSPTSLKPSQRKQYEGRRRFTEEEKRAILEGVRQEGKGQWAQIKERYKEILSHRTSGQIKDAFRTMLRRGEVPEDLLEESVPV